MYPLDPTNLWLHRWISSLFTQIIIYILHLSFREVACVYFVAIKTNTVEKTVFAFGCLFSRVAKSWSLFWNFNNDAPNSMLQFDNCSNKRLQDKVISVKHRFIVDMESCWMSNHSGWQLVDFSSTGDHELLIICLHNFPSVTPQSQRLSKPVCSVNRTGIFAIVWLGLGYLLGGYETRFAEPSPLFSRSALLDESSR